MWNDIRVGLSIASNTLRRGNKKTSILTISVLTLIFVNLVFLPSMINGMTTLFTDTVIDYGYGNIMIEPAKGNLYISNAESLLKKVNSVNGVSETTKRLAATATLFYREKYVGASIYGIVPDKEVLVSKYHEILDEGDYLSKMSGNEIMLGRFLAGEEDGPEVYGSLGGIKTGTLINVTFSNGVMREYKVIGIHEGGSELSDLVALMNFRELESVLGIGGEDKASSILVKTDKMGEEQEVKERLLEMGIKEKIETWQDKVQDLIGEVLDSFSMLTMVSVVVSLVIAVFVLFIIIYISTINRKRQIGILKAVGISTRSLVISYVIMSLFYTIIGIMMGGFLLGLLTMYFTAYPIHFYAAMYLAPRVELYVVLQGALSLIITSIIAGFIPSWLTTREPILKAIWGR